MPIPPKAPLPAERVPFPVEPHYRIRPDLRRLEPGEQRFVVDEAWRRYLDRKMQLLSAHPQQCRVMSGGEAPLTTGLWRVAESLAEELPAQCLLDEFGALFPALGVALSRDGRLRACREWRDEQLQLRVLEHLEPLPKAARLADALALAVQEDLVLIAGPAGRDSAKLLHVCFPSHWNPAERAGASFAQLHSPVPHNERLLAGSRNLIGAMLSKGPFIRHVWSLTRTPHLDQNPARPHMSEEESGPLLDRLYFRSERQTTSPLGDHALFTIRIYVVPLRSVLDPERSVLLAAAIRSMDSDLLQYKSLTELRGPLLEELDTLSSTT